MDLALCHRSGALNFEALPRYLKNLCTPAQVYTSLKCYFWEIPRYLSTELSNFPRQEKSCCRCLAVSRVGFKDLHLSRTGQTGVDLRWGEFDICHLPRSRH